MNKLILVSALVSLLGLSSWAQKNCTDVIYSIDNIVILDCCIDTIVNNNVVIYKKDGKDLMSKAIAINRNGQLITLDDKVVVNKAVSPVLPVDTDKYPYSYEHYESQYRTGKVLRGFGRFFLVSTIILAGTGILFVEDLPENASAKLLTASLFTLSAGIPLRVAGNSMKRKSLAAMKAVGKTRNNLSLSAGIGNNGAGLILNF